MATTTFPFNDLPVELQREIFIVAAAVDYASALRLVLVAKRVNSWVQPCIYDMVALGANDTKLFMRTVDSIPPEFFAVHVKKLCLSVSVGARNAKRILSTCTGVTDLAFWVNYLETYPRHSIVPLISPLPLRRLSIEMKHFLSLFTGPEPDHGWCETLTHLDIIFWTHELSPAIPHLEKLSSLTHLALRLRHSQAQEASLLAIVSARRSLKVLVIFDESDNPEDITWPADPRIVYLPYPSNVVREWEAQAEQGLDCSWSRAEDLVRKRVAAESKHLFFLASLKRRSRVLMISIEQGSTSA
ncbi:hypothetical protein M413DRAFT_23391 [Hebeloma cylindrosporum]|uniref:F-box domain-containing protein n=1 Tax=Hebeloma cylindrosporum TaxID=76867 RepID=A0A0C2Z1S3_HEBCY|nr:hypothetical protein M413DRAFT_23391 [Hebeloma cylindrosporum h7]